MPTPVELGAAYLDEKIPFWATIINETGIDMFDNRRCILGQLFGHVTQAFPEIPLGKRTTTFMRLGFWPVGSATDAAQVKSQWIKEILKRKSVSKQQNLFS